MISVMVSAALLILGWLFVIKVVRRPRMLEASVMAVVTAVWVLSLIPLQVVDRL